MTLKEAEKSMAWRIPTPRWWKEVRRATKSTQKDGQRSRFQKETGTTTPKKNSQLAAAYLNKIELKVLEGVGDLVAEVHLLKPVKEEQETPAPSQPESNYTWETKSRELNRVWNSWIADSPLGKPSEWIALQLLARADYLKKRVQGLLLTPQKVTYGEGVTALRKQVNIYMGDQLDISILQSLEEWFAGQSILYNW